MKVFLFPLFILFCFILAMGCSSTSAVSQSTRVLESKSSLDVERRGKKFILLPHGEADKSLKVGEICVGTCIRQIGQQSQNTITHGSQEWVEGEILEGDFKGERVVISPAMSTLVLSDGEP